MKNQRFLALMKSKILYISALLLAFGCGEKEDFLFSNLPIEKSGVTFANTLTETSDQNILDYLYFYNGGGVALGDINNDGLLDLFFSGNQVKNKLYLNKGNLQFEDITDKAGVEGNSTWNTGSIMGDFNNDGLLDIYVCAVVGINGFNGFNELYINNGNTTFTESAAKFGLDFDSYSSSAALLDYDMDGDLDLYLLNHAVHTQESYGRANLRNKRNYATGDKLMRNDGGKFIDVSEEAGIFGGVNGYGLGIAVSDLNQDGWPDMYVGNDFHEDDYYYINNQDGTFTESLKQYFGHTSRFSMGNDIADINHDGYPDIISLDMLPEEEVVLKSSEADDNVQMQKMRTENLGYNYQFTRNMLHINQNGGNFAETALLSGVAATDWSWSALFGDFNMDGEQDIFITNGIPRRPNDLDYIKFVSNELIKKKINNTKLIDQKALALMPSGSVHNYIFQGKGDLKFKDRSGNWIIGEPTVSTAAAYGDLDNDGDLDLVTSNINAPASIYINNSKKANYIKLKFKNLENNTFGIGTKVFSYAQGILQFKELYTTRGFQSSSEPALYFGYASANKVDSLVVVWPNNKYQVLKDVTTNQTLIIAPKKTLKEFKFNRMNSLPSLFNKVPGNLGINFIHTEDNYVDFNAQKLIPYKISDRGPATAIGDLDNDGKEDIFFGSSKYYPSVMYKQGDTSFLLQRMTAIIADSIKEDVSAVIADFNNDHKNDLIIGAAGGNFSGKAKPLLDRQLLGKDSAFIKNKFPEIYENSSIITATDFDKDGDIDLFIGSEAVSYDFGKIPASYLLVNDKGNFSIVKNEELTNIGMVTNALWTDYNNDGWEDLLVVGEWMAPTFFKNEKGKLIKTTIIPSELKGLWQATIPFDIDGDGDLDYMLGNWGTNTKFKSTEKFPLKMYYDDFDKNGTTETILVSEKDGKYYTLDGLDELSSQLSTLMRKKFNNYKSFAGKTIEEILGMELLSKAKLFEVNTLESGYLKNHNGKFSFVPFKTELQFAPIMAFLEYDFDNDGKTEVLAAGNYFGIKPYHGRLDSFSGAIIKNEKNIIPAHLLGLDLSKISVRHLNIITLNFQKYLLITINDAPAEVYKLANYK